MHGAWAQLIFVLVVVGFSVLKWLFQQISAQAEKRRRQQAIDRDELEALRTGRDPSPKADTAAAEQDSRDQEARRREELAELRRRAAARRGSPGQAPRQAKTSAGAAPSALEVLLGLPPGTTTGGTVSPVPRPMSKSPVPVGKAGARDPERQAKRLEQQKRRAQAEAAEARRRQQEQENKARAQRAIAEAAALTQARALDDRLLQSARPVRPAAPAGSPLSGLGTVPRNAGEWRRAIIMNEILNQPLSLR